MKLSLMNYVTRNIIINDKNLHELCPINTVIKSENERCKN